MPNDAVENLSPQLHNFIVIVTFGFLFIWALKALGRARSLEDLKEALYARNVVRLDGLGSAIREIGVLSRNHVQELLTARSRYTQDVISTINLRMDIAASSVRLRKNASKDGLLLRFGLNCSAPFTAHVLYGLRKSSIEYLYESRYPELGEDTEFKKMEKKKKKKKKRDGLHKRKGDNDESDEKEMGPGDVEMDSLRRGMSTDSVFSAGSYRLKSAVVQGGASQEEMELEVDTQLLLQVTGPAARRTYPLAVVLIQEDTTSAPTSSSASALEEKKESSVGRLVAQVTLLEVSHRRASTASMEDVSGSAAAAAAPAPIGSVSASEADGGVERAASNSQDQSERAVSPPLSPLNAGGLSIAVPSVRVAKQIVVTEDSVMELQDIFGIEDVENPECTICMVEPKDVVPLPCRHCCVCHKCYPHLRGKCPVCRSQILSYMQFYTPSGQPFRTKKVKPPRPQVAPRPASSRSRSGQPIPPPPPRDQRPGANTTDGVPILARPRAQTVQQRTGRVPPPPSHPPPPGSMRRNTVQNSAAPSAAAVREENVAESKIDTVRVDADRKDPVVDVASAAPSGADSLDNDADASADPSDVQGSEQHQADDGGDGNGDVTHSLIT